MASIDRISAKTLLILTAIILSLVPLHAFFTTWAGSNFGHLDAFRLWSEWLLIIGSPALIAQIIINRKIRRLLVSNIFFKLGYLFATLYLVSGIISLAHSNNTLNATLYSWIINLRFLYIFIFFCTAAVVNPILGRLWSKLLLIPASVVIIFGLMQKFLLDVNFLKHFGYGPDTIPAYSTVDNNPAFRRIQSTLRGPNPLGAYLLVIITYLSAIVKIKQYRTMGLILASLVVMYFSYSRSAWLGLAISVSILVFWRLSIHLKRGIVISVLIITASTSLILLTIKTSTHLQETVSHISSQSQSKQTSNGIRVSAAKTAIQNIIDTPFGSGPGSAGPASFRNTGHPAIIPENYFLQIGQEAGIIAIAVFMLINVAVAKLLWATKGELLSKILLASLVAITFINLLSHAWADDTLVYVWWGLAGIALAPSLLKDKNISNAKHG